MTAQAMDWQLMEAQVGYQLRGNSNVGLGDVADDQVVTRFRQHGVLMFTGFNASLQEFKRFSNRFSHQFSDYFGGLGRAYGAVGRQAVDTQSGIMTATGGNSSFQLPLHGELYYLKDTPRIIWFYCERPARADGQTIVCSGSKLLDSLSTTARTYFENHTVSYVRRMTEEQWQRIFDTTDVSVVEAFCKQNQTEFVLQSDHSVTAEFRSSAITGKGESWAPAFVNNILLLYQAERVFKSGWARKNIDAELQGRCPMVARVNGEPLPADIVDEVLEVAAQHTVDVGWQEGEFMMVDNHRVLHGRRQSDDPDRSILVRMGNATFLC